MPVPSILGSTRNFSRNSVFLDMGLIHRAAVALNGNGSTAPKEKKTGLLERIQGAGAYASLVQELSNWLELQGLDRGGLLCSPTGDNFTMACSIGFDLTTANRFVDCPSTLLGLAEDSCVSLLSGKDLLSLHSFFSSREASGLKKIRVERLSDFQVPFLALFSVESNLSIRRDSTDRGPIDETNRQRIISALKSSSSVISLLVPGPVTDMGSQREKIRGHLSAGMKAELVSFSFKSLGTPEELACDPRKSEMYRAIVSRIKKKAGNANVVRRREDFSLRVALFSSYPVDTRMYVRQMFAPLEKAFGPGVVAGISVENRGTSESLQDILEFIDGGC